MFHNLSRCCHFKGKVTEWAKLIRIVILMLDRVILKKVLDGAQTHGLRETGARDLPLNPMVMSIHCSKIELHKM